MRRLVLIAVPAVLAALVLPADAAPVTASRVAAVRFVVPIADGQRLDVDLRATAHGSTDVLAIAVSRCAATCAQPRLFSGPLPAGALSIDGQRATAALDTVVNGTPLRVTWTPDTGTGVVLGGARADGSGTDGALTTYRGDPAVTAVTVGDGSCRGTGSVGDQVDVATSDAGDPTAEPLGRLHLRPAGAPACGA